MILRVSGILFVILNQLYLLIPQLWPTVLRQSKLGLSNHARRQRLESWYNPIPEECLVLVIWFNRVGSDEHKGVRCA